MVSILFFQVAFHITLMMKEKNTTKLMIMLHDEHRPWQLHADVPLYNHG